MMTDRRRTTGAAVTAVITTHWGISMETSASLFSDPEQAVPRPAVAPHPAPVDNPFLAPPDAPEDEDAS
jgi:hypothetical protein